jgi:hypothetical protein
LGHSSLPISQHALSVFSLTACVAGLSRLSKQSTSGAHRQSLAECAGRFASSVYPLHAGPSRGPQCGVGCGPPSKVGPSRRVTNAGVCYYWREMSRAVQSSVTMLPGGSSPLAFYTHYTFSPLDASRARTGDAADSNGAYCQPTLNPLSPARQSRIAHDALRSLDVSTLPTHTSLWSVS